MQFLDGFFATVQYLQVLLNIYFEVILRKQ